MISLFEEINRYTPKKRRLHSHKYDSSRRQSIFDKNTSMQGWRLIFISLVVCLVYFWFLGRAISIQISDKEKYLALADKNRIREFSILPGRGLIYDTNGDVVVRNKPRFSVELNTLICESLCETAIFNAKSYIELDDEERVLRELNSRRTNILLATSVSKDQILGLESNLNTMPGISIETAPARDYLYSDVLAHILGYVGLGDTLAPTIVGKTGIEDYYNQYLSGVSGHKVVQVNSAGTQYSLITYKDPLPGKDVQLFVDAPLQQKAYEVLRTKIEDPEGTADAGAIVVQNPLDGSILAMVSYPSFDPNLLSSGISQKELVALNSDTSYPFYNRAISAAYPPGSVFKLVTASAILMEGVADAFTTIVDKGFIQVGSFIFRNWNLSGHGEVNLARALQVSNDTYFYIMGGGYGGVGGLGISKLSKWAKLFGYSEKTSIDIDGEVSGYMPDGTEREWYLGDDYISSIGQGDILATPLQVNNMMTYFANGGYLFSPRIVKHIDGVGETDVNVLAQNLINSDAYKLIRKGVNLASSPGGTAYPLFDIPAKYGIQVGGKTGTSEYIDRDGTERTHAWFSMFAPYFDDERVPTPSDNPITITVFLEGGGGGSDDATPLAREVLGLWLDKKR